MAHEPRLPVREGNGRGSYPAPGMFESVMPEKPREPREPWHRHPFAAVLLTSLLAVIVSACVAWFAQSARIEAQDVKVNAATARNEAQDGELSRLDAAQRETDRENAKLAERLAGLIARFEDALRRLEQQNERK